MIAADSSSLIAYFEGADGDDVQKIDQTLKTFSLILPPVVRTEILSDPKLPEDFVTMILALPALEIKPEYWEHSGFSRARLLSKKLKARLADTLIAQSCIDHDVPLITRDGDFQNFEKYCGLRLA